MTKKHMRWGWFFIAPYLIGFTVFTLSAVIFSGYLSFTDYNIFNPPEWVGLKNYINALTDPEVWTSFRNVFVYGILTEFLQLFLGCIVAVALNQKIKGMGAFRTMFFLPVLTPMVAVSFVWSYMYNPSYGIFNYILSFIGLGPFSYTFSSNWFEFVVGVSLMNVWKGLGYTSLYLLGGLQNISQDVMEAADIDGAGPIRKFFSITVPLLTPTLYFLLVIGVINAMQIFDPFYVMATNANTGADVKVIGSLIYNNAFIYNKLGLASAISWIAFAVMAVLTWLQKYIEKRYVYYA